MLLAAPTPLDWERAMKHPEGSWKKRNSKKRQKCVGSIKAWGAASAPDANQAAVAKLGQGKPSTATFQVSTPISF